MTHWTKGIVYCTCGTCLRPTDKTRKLNKDRFDVLSIPHYVIKKGTSHGARHGNTEKQIVYHAQTLHQDHEDHIAGKGINSLNHYKLVHTFIPVPEAMKKPDAKAAVEKE